MFLDYDHYYPINTIYTLNLRNQKDDKQCNLSFLLGIINSTLFKFLYNWKLDEEGKVYPQVKKVNVEWLPIPDFRNPEILKTENPNFGFSDYKDIFVNFFNEYDLLNSNYRINWDSCPSLIQMVIICYL